jgi:site-specific DNA-methyltransferase (adenine-specific)
MKNCIFLNDDCRNFLKTLEDGSIELVLIDPPYGIEHLNQAWDRKNIDKLINASKKSTVGSIPVGMKFNPKTSKNMALFLNPIFNELRRVLKPGGFCLVFSQPRTSHRIGVAIEDAGFELRDQLIWNYGAGQGKAQGMQNFIKKNKSLGEQQKEKLIEIMHGFKTPQLTPTFETIWLAQKSKEGKFWENFYKHGVGLVDFRDGSRKVSFSHSKPNKKEREEAGKHPTLKPVLLVEDLVKIFSPKNGTVLDCFAGSGTTAIAAIKADRKFVGCELDKEYFDKASERIRIYQNQLTERENRND